MSLDTELYADQARVTLSTSFHGELVSHFLLETRLREFVTVCNQLDQMKKALFYGRNAEGLKPVANAHSVAKPGDVDAMHAIIGIATEAGELVEALLNGENDKVNMLEEIGDVMWYMSILARQCGGNLEDCADRNIAKMRMRYGEKFSEYDANNRNLPAERSVLEHVPTGAEKRKPKPKPETETE